MEGLKKLSESNVGEWIKEQITVKGVDVEYIATELGKDQSTIHRWTTRPKIEVKKLKSFADLLDIDLREHFAGVDHLYRSRRDPYTKVLEELLQTKNELALVKEELAQYKREK